MQGQLPTYGGLPVRFQNPLNRHAQMTLEHFNDRAGGGGGIPRPFYFVRRWPAARDVHRWANRRMAKSSLWVAVTCLIAFCDGADLPKVRPSDWAQPVVGSPLGNFCRVSDDLYRSEQPTRSDIPDLKAMGIRSVLSLRHYHSDAKEFERAGIARLPLRPAGQGPYGKSRWCDRTRT